MASIASIARARQAFVRSRPARIRPRAPGARAPAAAYVLPLLAGLLLTPGPCRSQVPADSSAATVGAGDTLPWLYELSGVRVDVASRTGSDRGSVARSVEVITREEIRRSPASSVADLLRWATGVEARSRSAAQSDLAIRGSSFEQVVVLVDGVRVNDPQTGHFNLDLAVPLESIERIEIVRGPASSLYGPDAFGGVVNVVTREPGPSGLETARAEGGSWGQAGAAAVGGVHALGSVWSGGAELRRSDGHRSGTDYRIAKATARGRSPVAGGRLRTEVGLALRDFGANGFYAPYDSYEETRAARAAVGWSPGKAGGLEVTPRLTFRLHDDDFVLFRGEPERYRNRHTSWQLGAEVVGRARPAAGISLAGGVELRQEELDSNSLGRRSESRGAIFAEAVAGEAGRLLGTVGLRLDEHEIYGAELSPGASVAWWPLGAVELRGSVGRSYRTPTWTDRFYESPANRGNPDLEPEVAWSGEVGVELHSRRLRGGVTGFVRGADELIDYARPADADPATTPWRARNVESATYRGLEVEARARAPLDLDLEGALELLSVDASAAAGFVSKRALRPLTERFRLEARRGVGGDVTISARWTRARRRGGEPYRLLDARAAYRAGGVELYVEGTNLTDEDYPDITGEPAPGAALVAGLELEDP